MAHPYQKCKAWIRFWKLHLGTKVFFGAAGRLGSWFLVIFWLHGSGLIHLQFAITVSSEKSKYFLYHQINEAARMNHAKKKWNNKRHLMFSLITVFLCLNCRRNCLHEPRGFLSEQHLNSLLCETLKLQKSLKWFTPSQLALAQPVCMLRLLSQFNCYNFCYKKAEKIKSTSGFWYRHWAIDRRKPCLWIMSIALLTA